MVRRRGRDTRDKRLLGGQSQMIRTSHTGDSTRARADARRTRRRTTPNCGARVGERDGGAPPPRPRERSSAAPSLSLAQPACVAAARPLSLSLFPHPDPTVRRSLSLAPFALVVRWPAPPALGSPQHPSRASQRVIRRPVIREPMRHHDTRVDTSVELGQTFVSDRARRHDTTHDRDVPLPTFRAPM